MKKQNKKTIIEKFKENFDKLTYAQQAILGQILERDRLALQNDVSPKCVVNHYIDCHSDYYDAVYN